MPKFSKINFFLGAMLGGLTSTILYLRFVGITSEINIIEAILVIVSATVAIAIAFGYTTSGLTESNLFDGDIALFLITPLIAFAVFWLMIFLIENM